MNPIDQLAQEITDNGSASDSAVVLLDNLGQFMKDHANDSAAISKMGTDLLAQKQKLADAVVRNTPADTGGTSGPTTV